MRRIAVGVLAASVAIAMTAPASASTTLLKRSITAKSAKQVRCHSKLRTGKGVVRRNVRIGRSSLVRANLLAKRGDWDVAIFQARDKRLVGASSGIRSRELAEGFADAGRLIVQACRTNRRTSRGARLSVRSVALPQKTGKKRTVVSLVSVNTPSRAAKTRLTGLGLDVTEHGSEGHLDVVLHGAADAAKLRAAGFTWRTEVADLALQSFRNRQANARYRARTKKSALPSGRDDYRRLADFEADLKALVRARPDLAKPIVMPNRSLEGRLIHGVEITQNVNAPDGKPVFFQMGVHHAREWPSAEMPMEFATDLVKNYGKDARITNLVNRVRTIVVPVINPDGFNLSREAEIDLQPIGSADPYSAALSNLLLDPTGIYGTTGPLGANGPLANQIVTNPGHTAAILADGQIDFAYKRRNCRIEQNKKPAPGACAMQENRALGTDPNRNYGGFWGGPGASNDPGNDTFRGSAPFSEPEVQNVRQIVASRQVTTLITNHTFSNLVLRVPGVAAEGPSPDEPIYKALGDAMAGANGYASQYGYELYDTTGTTEDWSYYQSGGLGFTFEIGPNEFHPPYSQVVAEYEGNPSTPVDREPFNRDKKGGNREAYLIAMESTANTARHSVVTGRAPAGATLEVTRTGTSLTSPVVLPDDTLAPPISLTDVMRSSTRVPASGRFEWHINPSTRPYAKKDRRQYEVGKTPTSRQNISGGPATERIPITLGAADKGLKAVIDVGDASDYDIYLYDSQDRQVASGPSGFLGEDESLAVTGLPPGAYELEVRNFAAAEPWTGTIEKFAAVRTIGQPPKTESWLLTCRSASGRALGKRNLTIERGQRVALTNVCGSQNASTLLSATSRGKLKVRLRARRPRSLGSLLRRGMRVRVSCARSCVTLLRLRRGKSTIATKRARLRGGRSKVVRLKVTRRAARKLRKAKSARLTLSATGRALTGPREIRRAAVRFRVRR